MALKMVFPGSPNVRSLFVREPEQPGSTRMRIQTKGGMGKNILLFYFEILWDEEKLFLYGLNTVTNEIGRLTSRDASQHKLVSPLVAEHISDLSLVGECLRQLKLYQPWYNLLENRDGSDSVTKAYTDAMQPLADLLEVMKGFSFAKAVPSDDRFDYPSHRNRTANIVKRMREAEKNLDDFWVDFDSNVVSKAKSAKQLHLQTLVGPHEIEDSRMGRASSGSTRSRSK